MIINNIHGSLLKHVRLANSVKTVGAVEKHILLVLDICISAGCILYLDICISASCILHLDICISATSRAWT